MIPNDIQTVSVAGNKLSRFSRDNAEWTIGALRTVLTRLQADHGATTVCSGLHIGAPMWGAQEALRLDEPLDLHAYLPYDGVEDGWTIEQQRLFRKVLAKADFVQVEDSELPEDPAQRRAARNLAFMARAESLVDAGDVLVVAGRRQPGTATAMHVERALSAERPVILVDAWRRTITLPAPAQLHAWFVEPERVAVSA